MSGAPALDDPKRCQAHRRNGEPCRNWALRGCPTCRLHGSGAKQVRAAAKRRLAEQAIRKQLTDVDVEPLGDPVEAMIALAERAIAAERVLTDRIAALEQLASGSEAARLEWRLWLEVLDRAHKFVVALAGLGLEERRIALAEHQMRLIADIFRRVIEDAELGLNGEQRRLALNVSARHLRLEAGNGSTS